MNYSSKAKVAFAFTTVPTESIKQISQRVHELRYVRYQRGLPEPKYVYLGYKEYMNCRISFNSLFRVDSTPTGLIETFMGIPVIRVCEQSHIGVGD